MKVDLGWIDMALIFKNKCYFHLDPVLGKECQGSLEAGVPLFDNPSDY